MGTSIQSHHFCENAVLERATPMHQITISLNWKKDDILVQLWV